MAGSRHLRGTVASRVRNLLRSGAITKAWEPVWFPVVEAFPPLVDTKVNRRAEAGRMQKLTYPEDVFRKKFYERFETNQPLYLWGDHPSHCDRFVDMCMQLVQEGMEHDEAFENAVTTLKSLAPRRRLTPRSDHLDELDADIDDILDDKDVQDLPLDEDPPDLK